MVEIPGGRYQIGTDDDIGFPDDGEGPARTVSMAAFAISKHAVSNSQFAEFVDASGYVTDAERYGWSFVFQGFLPTDHEPTRGVVGAPWWRQVHGADWSRPEGRQSDNADRDEHPVVHVSFRDAMAYCRWAGVRLPTEAEWECATRGGLTGARYPWGDEFAPDGETMCNIFEGTFPTSNTGEDGFRGTAPVYAFPPNGYGLHNVAGNVWEWCDDWFSTTFHAESNPDAPRGPAAGLERVMRGGSYLCHDSYCNRYRVAARSRSTADSSTGNLGFRVAADV